MILEFISDYKIGVTIGLVLGIGIMFLLIWFTQEMQKVEKERDARHKQLLHAILNKK